VISCDLGDDSEAVETGGMEKTSAVVIAADAQCGLAKVSEARLGVVGAGIGLARGG
jgi:hypothetical protein